MSYRNPSIFWINLEINKKISDFFTKYKDYFLEATEISLSGTPSPTPLVTNTMKLFALDSFVNSAKLNCFKVCDAMDCENDILYLLEFKGWTDVSQICKSSLKLKAFESLFCILPRILDAKIEQILELKINLIIVISKDLGSLGVRTTPIRTHLYRKFVKFTTPNSFDLQKYKGIIFEQILIVNHEDFNELKKLPTL